MRVQDYPLNAAAFLLLLGPHDGFGGAIATLLLVLAPHDGGDGQARAGAEGGGPGRDAGLAGGAEAADDAAGPDGAAVAQPDQDVAGAWGCGVVWWWCVLLRLGFK